MPCVLRGPQKTIPNFFVPIKQSKKYTSTIVQRQEKLSCLTPLSALTDVVKVKCLAKFKRLEKGLSFNKKKFPRFYPTSPCNRGSAEKKISSESDVTPS